MVRHGSGVKSGWMNEAKLSDGTITLSPLRLGDVEAHLTGDIGCCSMQGTRILA
ncbi:hypothetical protein GCM10009730_50540 [Streptomyces albidochromogenes]